MSNFPLLRLGKARAVPRPAGTGRPQPSPRLPSRSRQGERFGPRFRRLADALAEGRDPLALRDDPAGLAPERVLVFEVAGSVSGFDRAVARIPGLEYLAEHDAQFPSDDDFWVVDERQKRKGQRRDDKPVGGCVYMAMPDLQALKELLGLWRIYQTGGEFGYGFAPWRSLFNQLMDLRTWGPRDRITPEVRDDFRYLLDIDPSGLIAVEIELWPRTKEHDRRQAFEAILRIVGVTGGSILDDAEILQIGYHAVLAEVPRSEIERLTEEDDVQLAICDDIMYVRPQSVASLSPSADSTSSVPATLRREDLPARGFPVAALLDGMPVQRHQLLDGRIIVDDPDGVEDESTVAKRRHGTEMASLILHGDLAGPAPESALSRPLHVHPVLWTLPGALEEQECFHPRRLLIDTFYRAVLRMKEGEGGGPPSSPDVFLINVSLGDSRRPYANQVSPWARLLDYLACRFHLLFLVSAGNISEPLPIPGFSGLSEFEDAPIGKRQIEILTALGAQRSRRTLLSPAEAINVVTVGACHDEAAESPAYTGTSVDPIKSRTLPNVSSRLGLGHLRTVKPDLLMPGGREHVTPIPRAGGLTVRPTLPGHAFGIRAAAPDSTGRLDHTRPTSGTSAATALATRLAHRIFDALTDPDNGNVLADANPRYYAVVVRALLVHGCRWDEEAAEQVKQAIGPSGQHKAGERGDNVARVLGRGVRRADAVTSCAADRAPLIGYGEIENGQVLEFQVPLPISLSGRRIPRAVTITLAWFSPVTVSNRVYRRARLAVEGHSSDAFGTTQRSPQLDYNATRRGTIFNERREGEAVVDFTDDDHLSLRITCTTPVRPLDEAIPFGIVVTIEAGEQVPIYEEIRAALAVRVRA